MATKQGLKIAVVDDEEDMRQSIAQWLTLSGFAPVTYASAEDALGEIGPDWPGIVITDIKMPGMGGMAFLKRLAAMDSQLPVIVITGHGDVPMAVEAMRIGAYDFLEKPFDPERMSDLARRALQARRLVLENRQLRRELADGSTLMRKLVGTSAPMQRLREEILDIAQADGHVLIEGEAGTGKSLVAHALHAAGPRQGSRLVTVNCAAHAPDELERLLFGPAEDPARPPAVEAARSGTLVLEDVEQLPPPVQARLLELLDGDETVDLPRIVSISNHPDAGMGAEQALRPDLFYRLAALRLRLPPLRERGEDVLALFNRYLEIFAEDYGCAPPEISAADAAQLMQAPWPGNVRQLINLAERVVLQSRRGEGSITQLLMEENRDAPPRALSAEGKPLKEYVEAFERMLIDNAMRRHKGSVAKVIEELKVPRRTLNEKMAKYGLSRADYIG